MSALDKLRRLAYLRSLQSRVADEIAALEYQLDHPKMQPLPETYQTIGPYERAEFLADVAAAERRRVARFDASRLRWERERAS